MVFFRSTGTPVIVAMPRGVPRFPRGEGRPDTHRAGRPLAKKGFRRIAGSHPSVTFVDRRI
jgi:hypothetical protein